MTEPAPVDRRPLGRWYRFDGKAGRPAVVVEDDVEGFPEWRVVFWFLIVDGKIRLAETRVIPAADRRRWWARHPRASARSLMTHFSPGEWADPDLLSALGDGVPGRLHRHIRSLGAASDVERLLRGRIIGNSLSIESDEYERAQSFDDLPVMAEPSQALVRLEGERPRSSGRDDRYYAVWASRYLEAFHESPRSPAVALSAHFGVSRKQAHYLVLRARERGLLLGGQQGRPGGQLSDNAKRLLLGAASDGNQEETR